MAALNLVIWAFEPPPPPPPPSLIGLKLSLLLQSSAATTVLFSELQESLMASGKRIRITGAAKEEVQL